MQEIRVEFELNFFPKENQGIFPPLFEWSNPYDSPQLTELALLNLMIQQGSTSLTLKCLKFQCGKINNT